MRGITSKYKGVQNDRQPRCLGETDHQDRKVERRANKYILDLGFTKDLKKKK